MLLSIGERLQLLQVLPQKGSYTTGKILTQLRLSLGLTEDEFEEWGIRHSPETNQVFWDVDGKAEIPIGEVATGLVIDALRELDRKEELPFELIEMYERFIPTTE